MRSLTVKLTLAFLLVGVIGVLIFALLIGQRSRTELSRFLSARDQTALVSALENYYATHGSWDGIAAMLAANPSLSDYSRDATLADADGRVVLDGAQRPAGRMLPPPEMAQSLPISAGGKTVGYLRLGPGLGSPPGGDRPGSTAADFYQRVAVAAAVSALIAALVALALGTLLARSLTRSVRDLTAATWAMAGGQLGHAVAVRSHDEIGELAQSFNQMSADLAAASQARKQMTADLAHDLRTPLTILRGYTEGLQEGRLTGSMDLYAVMHDEVTHLQRLVEDLRTLSLADAGQIPLRRRPVDPKALLERAALAHVVQAEAQGVALRVEAEDELPAVTVDTDRLAQVLDNLVANSLRHTVQGEIVLSARADADRVRLAVRDTGDGIAADDLPFVFERFYRGDKSRHRAEGDVGSSGLGLAIAKALVEAHGGSLTVSSTPGQGSTFEVALP